MKKSQPAALFRCKEMKQNRRMKECDFFSLEGNRLCLCAEDTSALKV